MAKYLYGPVPSRRLGQSLGVSPIPEKTCNYNCIYCQLGKTTNFINYRKQFFNPTDILAEICGALKQDKKIDYITFVGEGEPTLSKDIGYLIDETKRITDIPIAVITNGSLLSERLVREELKNVDVVIPTFDAGNSKLFRFINRPHKEIRFNKIVKGLRNFGQEFTNQLWIEIMLLKDINDSIEILEEIRGFLDEFHPDKVQINIPSRPPIESWVKIPENETLKLSQLILKSDQILSLDEVGSFDPSLFRTPLEALLSISKRHPLQYNQALEIIHQFEIEDPQNYLDMIVSRGRMKILNYRDRRFIYRDDP